MQTECIPQLFEFQGVGKREVVAKFDGGTISSDAGVLLLSELDTRRWIVRQFAECFIDHRDAESIEFSVETLLRQRTYALALGYEDLNDHDLLRADPLIAAAVGVTDPLGTNRRRAGDRGKALAGKSTLNRLELRSGDAERDGNYKKIEVDGAKVDAFFVDVFLQAHREIPHRIVLDVDATDDPLHGRQEGRFFHGYYRSYCYLPLYIFCGDFLLCARLRPSNTDASKGVVEELERIVGQIRKWWPKVEVVVRGDSGFCRDELMTWCEENRVDYVFGLAKNARLLRAIGKPLQIAAERHAVTGEAEREYAELRYRTRSSWSRERRVIGKAEQLVGKANPRFIVTTLPIDDVDRYGNAVRNDAKHVYEKIYCARGEMENRIKEQQLDLFADRTSAATMAANQLRLWMSSVAYVLMNELRRVGLDGTTYAESQCGTIRTKLLKIGARVTVSVRRVKASMSSAFPYQELFRHIYSRLMALEPLRV